MTVVNACLVAFGSGAPVPSFLHKTNDVLSSCIASEIKGEDFEQITVNSITPDELFSRFGAPFYVKIDLEGLDGPITKATLQSAPDIP